MSYDLGIWRQRQRISNDEAGAIYVSLCDDNTSSAIQADPAIDSFYQELCSIHPELVDVPDDKIDDSDFSPWSVSPLDRSDGHMLITAVWSKADHVHELVHRLARKHGLAVYNPQDNVITYPDSHNGHTSNSKPWWKFWA